MVCLLLLQSHHAAFVGDACMTGWLASRSAAEAGSISIHNQSGQGWNSNLLRLCTGWAVGALPTPLLVVYSTSIRLWSAPYLGMIERL